jgi:peptide/nickel transport system permease protein
MMSSENTTMGTRSIVEPRKLQQSGNTVLSVRNIVTEVGTTDRRFAVVRGVSLNIDKGEAIAVVGESGSGKSMLALTILGLLPRPSALITSGQVILEGNDLTQLKTSTKRAMLGSRIAAIFQDPMSSLNPVFTIGNQIVEAIRQHNKTNAASASKRAAQLLEAVHIPNAHARLRAYPNELSGGQRQRVAIAMAIANDPALLIADEPTTALDVTVQSEILDLLTELQQRVGMAMMFITHDLGVAREICNRVAVMYAGRIVEEASTSELFAEPLHPYTRQLMRCAPELGRRESLNPIPGTPPPLDRLPPGCPFAPRCEVAGDECRVQDITLYRRDDRKFACLHPGELP